MSGCRRHGHPLACGGGAGGAERPDGWNRQDSGGKHPGRVLVLGIKYLAFAVTGSVALYSDALESFVNVATAIAALLAVRLSEAPPDRNHPYGHYKVEYFSAVLAGVLIIVAALLILREAWDAVLVPRTIEAPAEGLALSIVASVINAGWSWVLITQGRKLRSPALAADGRHLFSDVVTSVGVVIGIVLAVTHRLGDPRPGARGPGRGQHPVVGLAGDPGVARRPDGRGGARDRLEQIRGVISTTPTGRSRRTTCAPATPAGSPSSTSTSSSRRR